jgi:hypothetical protein
MHDLTHSDYDALIERVRKLRVLLPAMSEEAARARRDAARLRVENASLRGRVAELESAVAQTFSERPVGS